METETSRNKSRYFYLYVTCVGVRYLVYIVVRTVKSYDLARYAK